MAAALQKILRKSSYLRIAAALNKHRPPDLLPSLLSSQGQDFNGKNPDPHTSFLDTERAKIPFSQPPSHIFPSLPFGYLLNPIPSSVFEPLETEADETGDAQTVWADSVKKKRKKKMNKHKYKKLRKRLRRKT